MLAGYDYNHVLRRIAADFCSNPVHRVERVRLFLTDFTQILACFVTLGCWFVCVDRIFVDLVQKISKPSLGNSNFLGFLVKLRTRLAQRDYWSLIGVLWNYIWPFTI